MIILSDVGSYSFYSYNINNIKYKEIYEKALEILKFKNELSEILFKNLISYLDASKFDIIKEFGNKKANISNVDFNLIRGNELQKAVADVLVAYSNKIDSVKSKISFKVQSKISIKYYKRNTSNHKKGDVKKFALTHKRTKLSKCLTYLAKYGYIGIGKELHTFKSNKKEASLFFNDLKSYLNLYGEERLLKLAFLKRENIISKYNKFKINFTKLSYRSAVQTETKILQNHKGITNAFLVIPNMTYNRKKMIIQTKFKVDHHGHLNQFKTKEYIVCVEKDRIRFILTKNVNRKYATCKNKFLGCDVNIKHNLFMCSNGKSICYDKKTFNSYIRFLKKLDTKKEKSSGEIKQYNLWQLRIKNMLKRKCNDLVNLSIQDKKDHIIMEDLSMFGKSFIKSLELEGFKYSRLTRLLNLSNLNNIVRSICQKKGIQLTIIPSHYTSQLCNKCGHISRENRKSQECFECVSCGHKINADLNASINILLIGKHEVHAKTLLIEDSSSWFIPKKFLRKEFIKDTLEDIILKPTFQ